MLVNGDGGLGKTTTAEALMARVPPGGYWFVDDPDDFREVEGYLLSGQGLIIDEIRLASMDPNTVKKLLDVEKARRISCRHFNGTIPAGCPRILCTNSPIEEFYPRMPNPHDKTGVYRRHLWQNIRRDVRSNVTFV